MSSSTQVIIIGEPKSGKSRLAALIHNALITSQVQRFDVVVVDKGLVENPHRNLMEVTVRDIPQHIVIDVRDESFDNEGLENELSEDANVVHDSETDLEPSSVVVNPEDSLSQDNDLEQQEADAVQAKIDLELNAREEGIELDRRMSYSNMMNDFDRQRANQKNN